MKHAQNCILFRADGGPGIGIGHVMRCIALAKALQEKGLSTVFVTAVADPLTLEKLRMRGNEVVCLSVSPGSKKDAIETHHLAFERKVAWVVLDGYQFGADYQLNMRSPKWSLLTIDDHVHATHYHADVLLNQNIAANEALYSCRDEYTKLLLGPKYALLRPEFLPWRSWERKNPSIAHRVLITLGGSDPENLTASVISALDLTTLKDLQAVIVVGPSNKHLDEITSLVRSTSTQTELIVDSTDMPSLMAWADVAISAAGSTAWELCFMGLPSLLIVLAPNQLEIAKGLDVAGAAHCLGEAKDMNPVFIASRLDRIASNATFRENLARKGSMIVDGQGAERVASVMMKKIPVE